MPTGTALVVEDESIIALDLKFRLEKMGFTVPAIASNGTDAVSLIDSIQPDFLLLDVNLRGGMDGTEVAEYAYTHYKTPILFITAYNDASTLQRALDARAQGFLLKPFSDEDLRDAVLSLFSNMEQD